MDVTITATVDDDVLGTLSAVEDVDLGIAFFNAKYRDGVEIEWHRPVDRFVRHITFVGEQEHIQPIVAKLVELSKARGRSVTVLRSLAPQEA